MRCVVSSRAGAFCAFGDMLSLPGTFDAVGDGNPVPERVGCPRLERIAPGRAECPPPASGMRLSVVAAEARDPRQPWPTPAVNCLGVRLEEARSR